MIAALAIVALCPLRDRRARRGEDVTLVIAAWALPRRSLLSRDGRLL
ncbi:hypothetical protein AB0H88_28305 [Nonomuraea sp. NPDC050680]